MTTLDHGLLAETFDNAADMFDKLGVSTGGFIDDQGRPCAINALASSCPGYTMYPQVVKLREAFWQYVPEAERETFGFLPAWSDYFGATDPQHVIDTMRYAAKSELVLAEAAS